MNITGLGLYGETTMKLINLKIFNITLFSMFFSVLFLASGMALWHYVNYMERYVLETDPFYKSWEPVCVTNSYKI